MFNKTSIPLTLVGYELVIADSVMVPRLLSKICYPLRVCGIIANYQIIISLYYVSACVFVRHSTCRTVIRFTVNLAPGTVLFLAI